jgi:3-hydroxyanthranilate 3,4-dioxygenase
VQPLQSFSFMKWIDEHRDRLKPPVCNQVVFEDSEFIVMVVGGPNRRTDFHWDPGEELFYQIEGDMLLKTVQEDRIVDVPIREGEMFLLPAEVPHSPQRFPDTVGLVIERRRRPEEKDGFMWFCEKCHHKLYEEYLHVSDIVAQLPPVFDRFYGDRKNLRCDRCGHEMAGREQLD